jgi:hypothetical protein
VEYLGEIAEGLYRPCEKCGLQSKYEAIFYDTEQDKKSLKVMIIFEQPGGRFGDDNYYVENFSPKEKSKYFRSNFPAWLARYYTYNLEIFRNLKNFNFISKDLTYFENAMEEIYFTDAIKCRTEGKEKGNLKTCSEKWLRQEIEELPKLELIIACGSKALNALKNISTKNNSEIEISKIPIKSYRKSNPIQTFAHGDIYEFKFKENKGIKVIHFAHPTYIYSRKVKEITPVIRENEFLKEACKFVFSNL